MKMRSFAIAVQIVYSTCVLIVLFIEKVNAIIQYYISGTETCLIFKSFLLLGHQLTNQT